MKKIILLLNFSLLLLTSCYIIDSYKYTNYFSAKYLEENLVADLIEPINANNMTAGSEKNITYETTYDSFYAYVNSIYDYLKNKNFIVCFEGYESVGMFGDHHEFYDSTCLEDHRKIRYDTGFYYDNYYTFIYCTVINEANIPENGQVINIKFEDNTVNMWFSSLLRYKYQKERGYYLGTLLPWLSKIDTEIVSLKKEITENNKINITSYLNDPRYIKFISSPNTYIKKYTGKVNDDIVYTFTYNFKDGSSYNITIVDDYLLLDNVYYYAFDGFFHQESYNDKFYDESYEIIENRISHVLTYTDSTYVKQIDLIGIKYIKINEIYDNPVYRLQNNSSFLIYNENIFSINNTYYKIISDKNFSELFTE